MNFSRHWSTIPWREREEQRGQSEWKENSDKSEAKCLPSSLPLLAVLLPLAVSRCFTFDLTCHHMSALGSRSIRRARYHVLTIASSASREGGRILRQRCAPLQPVSIRGSLQRSLATVNSGWRKAERSGFQELIVAVGVFASAAAFFGESPVTHRASCATEEEDKVYEPRCLEQLRRVLSLSH